MSSPGGRNDFLDFLKGILIVLVVSGHIVQYVVYGGVGFFGDIVFKLIYMFHMPLFMAVGGYVSFRGISGSPPLFFVKTKFFCYVVPVVFWPVMALLLSTLFGVWGEGKIDNILVIRASFGSLWFLWSLYLSLVATVLARLFPGRFGVAYALSLLCVLCLPDSGLLSLFKYTYPFFQVGYLAAKNKNRVQFLTSYVQWYVFVFFAALSVFLFCAWGYETYVYNSGVGLDVSNINNLLIRYLSGFVFSYLFVFLAYRFYSCWNFRLAVVLSLGKDSIFVYVLQALFFSLYSTLLIFELEFLPVWLVSVFSLPVGFLGSVLFYFMGRLLAKNYWVGFFCFGRTKSS